MNKERKVIVEEIRSMQDVPEDLVHDVIDEVVWGDDPVGREIAGTEETSHNTTARPWSISGSATTRRSRLVVAAGGDVRHEEVVALTERYFGDLKPVGEARRSRR